MRLVHRSLLGPARVLCVVVGVLLSGCMSVPSVGDSPSDGLATAQGTATAPWMALDLVASTYQSLAAPGDTTLAVWRDEKMLFRRVEAPTGPAYLAIFPVTQAQWQRLGGGTPWEDIDESVVNAGGRSGENPAYGLSWPAIRTALGAWNSGKSFALAAPSEAEWNAAAEGVAGGLWPWGDDETRSVVRDHALVWETLNQEPPAPQPVHLRTANAHGFHDMAGNVWEWCAPGTVLRGGSWRDGLMAARRANRLTYDDAGVDADTDHALFGLRLALRP